MNNRYIIPLLCTAALAYACGPWVHSQATAAAVPAQTAVVHKKRAPKVVATTLDVTPTAGHVGFILRVVNNTQKTVELLFSSGQTHEFVVLDKTGHPVWRWSDGRMFTQAMQSKTVRSRDTLTIADSWDARNEHGTYVAVATLNTGDHPIERRVEFTLP